MSTKTTYVITEDGCAVCAYRALGDAFRAHRALAPRARRTVLKRAAVANRWLHCQPPPAWANFVVGQTKPKTEVEFADLTEVEA